VPNLADSKGGVIRPVIEYNRLVKVKTECTVGVIRPVSEFKRLVEVKTEYIQYLSITSPMVKDVH